MLIHIFTLKFILINILNERGNYAFLQMQIKHKIFTKKNNTIYIETNILIGESIGFSLSELEIKI